MAADAGEEGVEVLFCFRAQRAGVDGVGYLWRGEGGRQRRLRGVRVWRCSSRLAFLGTWIRRLRRTPSSPRAMSPRGSGFSSQERGMMEAEVVSPGYLASGEASRAERARLLDEDEMSASSLTWRSEEELGAVEAREISESEYERGAGQVHWNS